MKRKQFIYLMLGVVGLLCLPFFGGLISPEVNWDSFDYLVMGFLLTITGLAAILVYNRFKNSKLKFIYLAAISVVFLLIYIELAVGIFGTPFAGN